MPSRHDPLDDFECQPLRFGDLEYDVYVAGDGPGVLVLPEIPGITSYVADCARRLIAAGFSVWMPSLYGQAGREVSKRYLLGTAARACVSRTFGAFARASRAPVIDWLRELGAPAQRETGAGGIGVIGMCFSGNFALVLAIDDRVKVPIMSQPSMPLFPDRRSRQSIAVAPEDLARIKQRNPDDLCAIGLRFTGDRLVPQARFDTLRRELGDAFLGIEIDSSPGNGWDIAADAHSVTTIEYSPDPAHPTNQAWEQIVAHLSERLLG